MKTQNIYALFSPDPAEFNKQALKGKLGITLIQLIRANGWNQAAASEHLKVAQPRVSDLMRGKLDRFSIDALMELMFRAGYMFDYEFGFPDGEHAPPRLEMKLKGDALTSPFSPSVTGLGPVASAVPMSFPPASDPALQWSCVWNATPPHHRSSG
ncbi:XRE family transcriptional regulator [Xanthomonas citri pv. citri]|nr:XRE family transcriptional regulator [Xanthomonas citri pv. citri]